MLFWCLAYLMGHGLFFKLPVILNGAWVWFSLGIWLILGGLGYLSRQHRCIKWILSFHGFVTAFVFLTIYYQQYYLNWRPGPGANWYLVEGIVHKPMLNVPDKALNKSRKVSLALTKVAQSKLLTPWYRPKTFIRVNWYQDKTSDIRLKQGNKIQVRVKLSHINGFENSAGFSFSKWLFAKHYVATGYFKGPPKILSHESGLAQISLDALQEAATGSLYQKYWLALTLGEQGLLSKADREWLTQMGIGHLLAISGLHIGIIYLALYLIFSMFFRVVRIDKSILGVTLLSLMCLWFYVYLLGFIVSATRAALLLTMWCIIVTCHYNINKFKVLSVIACVSLTLQPAAMLSAGWWLSFVAVLAILLFNELYWVRTDKVETSFSFLLKSWAWLKQLFALQIFISLFLIPVSIYWFSGFSIVGLLANLIAIPVFSLVIVPLNFFVSVLASLFGNWFTHFYLVQDVILECLFNVLEGFRSDWNYAHLASNYVWLGLVFTSLYLLFPVMRRFKVGLIITLIMVLPLASERLNGYFSKQLPVRLKVLDVGQGTGIALLQGEEAMIYDLGPIYRSGFNATEAVLVPVLRESGIKQIDTLVVSHLDNDHLGQPTAVEKHFVVKTWLLGCDGLNRSMSNLQHWRGIQWQVLWPDPRLSRKNVSGLSDNDQSCVVKIEDKHSGTSILLTGDIGKNIEKHLALAHQRGLIDLAADILISPHHGSKYSSSLVFIKAVSPEVVIHSAGVNNRFGFPTREVVDRYADFETTQFTTNQDGEITVYLPQTQDAQIKYKTHLDIMTPFWKRQNPFSIQQQIR